jgi:CRP-like cAMP-binding protein
MYILLKGELSLYSGTRETGGELEIARLVKGDVLGESCMTHTPFTLNCRAEQFTELIGIETEDIRKLVETNPALGVAFYQQVLTKVVGKMRNNNLQLMQNAGGIVLDSYIVGNEPEGVE